MTKSSGPQRRIHRTCLVVIVVVVITLLVSSLPMGGGAFPGQYRLSMHQQRRTKYSPSLSPPPQLPMMYPLLVGASTGTHREALLVSQKRTGIRTTPTSTSATVLAATTPSSSSSSSSSSSRPPQPPRRKDRLSSETTTTTTTQRLHTDMLRRQGPHFQFDRWTGQIEFGSTAHLRTILMDDNNNNSNNNKNDVTAMNHDETMALITEWLQEERSLATSIWDSSMMQERGNSVYRLQVMSLQFVTLRLSPWVDVRMKTVLRKRSDDDDLSPLPVFTLESVDFEPNLQILPGMQITAETLGIRIDVVGELCLDSISGRGVMGSISFQTMGQLPPPLRLLPESVLRAASDTINRTVVHFAIRSFQRGARANFDQFLQRRKLQ